MKPKINESMSLGQIVSHYPQTRSLLEKMGLDYCCGGKHTLSQAAAEAGTDPQQVIEQLNEAVNADSDAQQHDFLSMSGVELVDHIEQTHHVFMREQLPRLDALLNKVQRAHGRNHGAMLADLQQVFDLLRTDIEMHLEKEEQILFPYIRQIEASVDGSGPAPAMHCGTVQNPINQMEHEHDQAGDALAKMRQLTNDYRLPEDACESFKALYDGLQAMELDLHQHIHLENNILFPKSVRLEESLQTKQHS